MRFITFNIAFCLPEYLFAGSNMSLQSLDRLNHDGRIKIQSLRPLNDLLIDRLVGMIHDDNALLSTPKLEWHTLLKSIFASDLVSRTKLTIHFSPSSGDKFNRCERSLISMT